MFDLDFSSIDTLEVQIKMNKGLGAKILELRSQGSSYRDIESKLGCSKGLISYHCGVGQKEKLMKKQRRERRANVLKTKLIKFLEMKKKGKKTQESISKTIDKILKNKIRGFCLTERKKGRYVKCKTMFRTKDLLKKIGTTPLCYLTGRPIDLDNGKSYHLDHIVPRSKGGDNSLENCGLACREANQAKNDLSLAEFVQLCQEVLEKNKSN
jgi:5-methylcytosine-specific restriction endonuclease McrA